MRRILGAPARILSGAGLFSIIGLLTLSVSDTAGAHMTAFDPGVPPGQVQGGTVTLPDGQQAEVLTQQECEAQKQGDESCDGGALFVRTVTALPSGSRLNYDLTVNGQARSGSAVIGAGGALVAAVMQTTGLETIMSTARKREEPLQSTPVSSTVLSGEKLQMTYHNDLKTLAFPAPNVNIAFVSSFANAISIAIRGVSTSDIDSTIDPPVALFVDGVYLPRPVATSLDLFDVESIEILRGPQGTLFGRNTSAGAIQIRTKRPTDEFGITGRIRVGEYGRIDVAAAINVPIVEGKVAARIAVMSQNMDGYFRSSIDDSKLGAEDILSIRPIIQFTPSDTFDLTIIGEYHRNKGEPIPQVNQSPGGRLLCLLHGFCGTEIGEADDYVVPSSAILPGGSRGAPAIGLIDVETFGITVEANWDVGPGVITSISNYREMDDLFLYDPDGTVYPMFWVDRDQPHEQVSSELRFASTAWDSFDFVAGIYYFRQKYELTRNTFLAIPAPEPVTHLLSLTSQVHNSFSIFGEGNIHITDKLTIIIGGRWTTEKKNFHQEAFGPFPNTGPQFDDERKWNNFGPKAGFEYQWNDDMMTYFTYQRGFKSGGFNGRCGQTSSCTTPFDPEIVDGFELGLKAEFFDRKVRTNLALFWNEYKDIQRTVIVPLLGAANPQETVTQNAASSTIRGIELEVTALLVEGLQFDFSLGYLDAQYNEFCADVNGSAFFDMAPTSGCNGDVVQVNNLDDPGGAALYLVDEDLSDFTVARAPKVNLMFGLTYEFPVGNMGNIVMNGRVTYTSKLFTDESERSQRRSVTLVDASITYEDADGRYRISVFGKNLTGELYANSRTLVPPLFDTRAVNAPRRWGVEIGFDI